MSELTEKMKAFCDHYIETANATESYKHAYTCKSDGTARTNASRLLTKANIRAYIDARLANKERDRVASQDEVLEFLTSVLRGKVTETIPVVLKTHYEMVTREPGINERLRAAEDLAKRYGLFTEKIEHAGSLVVIKGEDKLED